MSSPVPSNSKPLHNFSLPELKWSTNHTNNHHRGRKLGDSSPQQSPPPDAVPRQSPPFDTARRHSPLYDSQQRQSPLFDSATRQSPIRDLVSESESSCAALLNTGFLSENGKIPAPERAKNGFSVLGPDHMIEKSEKKSTALDIDLAGVKEVRAKTYIRLRMKNKTDEVQDEGKTGTCSGELEESAPKTWNLRPRKPLPKPSNANAGASKAQLAQATGGSSQAKTAQKKEKMPKFSISLSRGEIEEDIFAMTGSKPSRRPKKRAKAVQKQLDNVFPGLWLGSITTDAYKVSEAPPKG